MVEIATRRYVEAGMKLWSGGGISLRNWSEGGISLGNWSEGGISLMRG